jgi:hypothetical protein
MPVWLGLLLTVRFLSELALLGGVAWLGALIGRGGWLSVLLAVVGGLAVAALWGLLMAPRAARRLSDPARLLVELVLFVGTGISLAQFGYSTPGVIAMGIAVVAAVLARASRAENWSQRNDAPASTS